MYQITFRVLDIDLQSERTAESPLSQNELAALMRGFLALGLAPVQVIYSNHQNEVLGIPFDAQGVGDEPESQAQRMWDLAQESEDVPF